MQKMFILIFFFFQAEDGIRDRNVTGVQTCALPISAQQEGIRTQAVAAELAGAGTRVTCRSHQATRPGIVETVRIGEEAHRSPEPVLDGFLGPADLEFHLWLGQISEEGMGPTVRSDLHPLIRKRRRVTPT